MRTLRWLDAEFDRRALGAIATAMAKDEYRPTRASGFQIAHLRADSIEGWFHERVETIDSITDPFGTVLETPRVSYRKLEFRLSSDWPSVELRDSGRTYGEFVAMLARYCDHSARLAPLRVDVSAWSKAVEERVSELAIIAMDFVDVGVSQGASGKVLVEGQRDVRRAAKKFLDGRDARLVRATISWHSSPSVVTVCELRESGSVRVHDGPGTIGDLLRGCLLKAAGR